VFIIIIFVIVPPAPISLFTSYPPPTKSQLLPFKLGIYVGVGVGVDTTGCNICIRKNANIIFKYLYLHHVFTNYICAVIAIVNYCYYTLFAY
jgi:hypothetical protein